MTHETPEEIAKKITDKILMLHTDRVPSILAIAQAIREASTVVLPKNPYVDQAINCMNEFCQHEIEGECDAYLNKSTAFEETKAEIKKLNPDKTWKEVE